MNLQNELFNYIKSLGIDVNTNTKARGHQGFCLLNRIDISKNTPKERVVPILVHEFAHYVHSKLEDKVSQNGGTLEKIFDVENSEICKKELVRVTNFVDVNSKCETLKSHKKQINLKIKNLDSEIKKDYPNFQRSKKFKEFDKFIKRSKARYLLKYDRVKLVSRWLRKVEIYSIENLENEFPDIPKPFCTYLRLKSAQRKQARISSRINKYNKYYEKPTELFARFVEGIAVDEEKISELAPYSTLRFYELLEENYYPYLKEVIELLRKHSFVSKF